jgi:hypothetical protein
MYKAAQILVTFSLLVIPTSLKTKYSDYNLSYGYHEETTSARNELVGKIDYFEKGRVMRRKKVKFSKFHFVDTSNVQVVSFIAKEDTLSRELLFAIKDDQIESSEIKIKGNNGKVYRTYPLDFLDVCLSKKINKKTDSIYGSLTGRVALINEDATLIETYVGSFSVSLR